MEFDAPFRVSSETLETASKTQRVAIHRVKCTCVHVSAVERYPGAQPVLGLAACGTETEGPGAQEEDTQSSFFFNCLPTLCLRYSFAQGTVCVTIWDLNSGPNAMAHSQTHRF